MSGASSHLIFQWRCQEFGGLLAKWIKRMRKGDAAHEAVLIRYLMVGEAHNGARRDSLVEPSVVSGRPHFHGLIHEKRAGTLVLPGEEIRIWRSDLNRFATGLCDGAFARLQWPYGFSRFELCDSPKAALYLTKYLDKAADYRVRASLGYGDGWSEEASPEKHELEASNAPDKGAEEDAPPTGRELS
jgi:hypothetical protein